MLENKKSQLDNRTTNIDSYEITEENESELQLNKQELGLDFVKIDNIINNYKAEKGSLISILQDLHKEYDHLTTETLIHVSKRMDLPLMQVYQVAMFYKEFKIETPANVSDKVMHTEQEVIKDYLSKFTK